MDLERLVAEYGLWAVALGAGAEGETAVVLGGISVHRGLLPFVPTALVAALGSFVADQVFFAIGRFFRGSGFVQRLQAKPVFSRALAIFGRHPLAFVFAFRFIYGMRTISPLAIGTTSLSAGRFLAVNALAALVWGAAFTGLGFLCGRAIEALFGRVGSLLQIALPVLLLAALCGLALRLVRRAGAAD